MTTLARLLDFLEARFAEDEADAQAASAAYRSGLRWEADTWGDSGFVSRVGDESIEERELWDTEGGNLVPAAAVAVHMARHDPAHVLADIAAKRQIVKECRAGIAAWPAADSDTYLEAILEVLAHPYAEHPDFDPTWRVVVSA
jgi:hypothetical protein